MKRNGRRIEKKLFKMLRFWFSGENKRSPESKSSVEFLKVFKVFREAYTSYKFELSRFPWFQSSLLRQLLG